MVQQKRFYSQTSVIELFAKVGNGSRFVDVQLGSKYTSVQDIFRNRTQDVNPQS